jgi:hypothetical protein
MYAGPIVDRDHPFNVFDFCRDHSARGIDAFLKDKGYRGYLNAAVANPPFRSATGAVWCGAPAQNR